MLHSKPAQGLASGVTRLANVLVDSEVAQTAYGGVAPKGLRRKHREALQAQYASVKAAADQAEAQAQEAALAAEAALEAAERMATSAQDDDEGVAARTVPKTDLVWHPTANKKTRWEAFKEDNPFSNTYKSLQRAYEYSENPVIITWKELVYNVQDGWRTLVSFGRYGAILTLTIRLSIGTMFPESEKTAVLRALCARDAAARGLEDPTKGTFVLDNFIQQAREYYIPEIVEAVLSEDLPSLHRWCSEGVRLSSYMPMQQPLMVESPCSPFSS